MAKHNAGNPQGGKHRQDGTGPSVEQGQRQGRYHGQHRAEDRRGGQSTQQQRQGTGREGGNSGVN